MLGDRIVYEYDEKHQWTTQQHFMKRYYYPIDGNGANVTYVKITVNQVNQFSFRKNRFHFVKILFCKWITFKRYFAKVRGDFSVYDHQFYFFLSEFFISHRIPIEDSDI